jgi:hypothetical protein
LAATLTAIRPRPDDVVLVLPGDGSMVLASGDRLIDVALRFDGAICVAATTVPLSPTMAGRISDAVARATGWTPVSRGRGWRPARAHPYPYGLLGPASALGRLGADCAGVQKATDADHMAATVLGGHHPLVLDVAANVFHVLDGTGTDAVAANGSIHTGGEQPLVLIDPADGSPALSRLQAELADGGSQDLARLLGYEGAIDDRPDVLVAAPEIIVTPFWTVPFCTTVVRAAEAVGSWSRPPADPGPRLEVSLRAISDHLFGFLAHDLRERIWPRLGDHWPQVTNLRLADALVVRHEAGDAETPLTPPSAPPFNTAVRLNEGYGGGGLFFPRQGWEGDVPVGFLTMWPAAATHPHQVDWVTEGVKYSLELRWSPNGP